MDQEKNKIHAPSMVLGLLCGIILLGGGWLAGSHFASKNSNNQTSSDSTGVLEIKENTISGIAKSASKSVVHIKALANAENQSPLFEFSNPPGFRQNGGMFDRESGSGIIIKEDGYVVTNNHVLGSANTIIEPEKVRRNIKVKSSVEIPLLIWQ